MVLMAGSRNSEFCETIHGEMISIPRSEEHPKSQYPMRLEAEITTSCVRISLPASHHNANAIAANFWA